MIQKKLLKEIKGTDDIIKNTKEQIESDPILESLLEPLKNIEKHFYSLSNVANNYEDVYKNIILPVKEEGKKGVRQTVKWAIISILLATLLSVGISWMMK